MRIISSLAVMSTMLVAILPTQASAKTVHLDCVFSAGPSPDFQLTIDEESSWVSRYIPRTGFRESYTSPRFVGDDLMFENDVFSFVVNRTDLKFIRSVKGGRERYAGICRQVRSPKREF